MTLPFCAPILALVAVASTACDSKKGNIETEESSSSGNSDDDKDSSEKETGKNKKKDSEEDETSPEGSSQDGEPEKDDPNSGPDNTTSNGNSSSDDGQDSAQEDKEVEAKDFCRDMSEIVCSAEDKCCENKEWKSKSVKECIQSSTENCDKEFKELFDDKRAGYDKKKAARSLARLKTKMKDCDPEIGDWFISRTTGMLSIFGGSVNKGESCTPDGTEDRPAIFSCKEGLACRIKVGLPPTGSCGEFKKAGDGCVTHFECSDSLWCTAPMGAVGKCEVRKALGKSCEEGIECESLSCEGKKCSEPERDEVYCVERPDK